LLVFAKTNPEGNPVTYQPTNQTIQSNRPKTILVLHDLADFHLKTFHEHPKKTLYQSIELKTRQSYCYTEKSANPNLSQI